MLRTITAAAVGLVLASAGTAAAQDGPFQFKPIDTDKLIVRPVDQAAGFFNGATRTLSRVVGGSVSNNGFVRTVNNLFGTRAQPDPTQMNGIPPPSAYPSVSYTSPITPRMPTSSQFQR